MSSQLLVTIYTLSTYPSAHKQLRRHLPNPFCEFPYFQKFFLPVDFDILQSQKLFFPKIGGGGDKSSLYLT